VPWLNAARNLAPARALPISRIRAALRETDVTESWGDHSLLRTTCARKFPEIVVNNHDGEHLEFRIIETRYTSRPGDLWGRSETVGTLRKRSYALAHAHWIRFELDFKKKIKAA
jgi:hypothetical protein